LSADAQVMIHQELERCRPWIEAALEYSGGTHDFGDIASAVMTGHMQLWPAPKGCMVTEIITYPKIKALHIFLAGGELRQLLQMEDSIASWAKSQNCGRITLNGRPGWKRVLEKRNAKVTHTFIAKDIL